MGSLNHSPTGPPFEIKQALRGGAGGSGGLNPPAPEELDFLD
jgi:hypothetical protein